MLFTFLNTTDAPNLSGASTRQMRAHVTKNNFKQRRQRLAIERFKRRKRCHSNSQEEPDSSKLPNIAVALGPYSQIPWHHTDPDYSILFLLHEFRPLLFPAETGDGISASESEWTALLRSEPALVEASMSVALEHWPRAQSGGHWRRQAYVHSCAAMNMVSSRLNAGHMGLTDGVIGAVFVLTFGERLSKNEFAVGIHLDGLSRMITQRRAIADYTIPSWFLDLLLYDSIQETICSTPHRKEQIVTALRKKDTQTLGTVSHISDGLNELRHKIEGVLNNPSLSSTMKEIEAQMFNIQQELRPLFNSNVLYVAAMSRAINLFLLLSWPSASCVDYAFYASHLQDALSQPRMALCGSTNLTVWQYFVGGVGAAAEPSLRSWYISKLANIFRVMHITNWKTCFQVLEKAFTPDSILLMRFKALWEDISEELLSS